MVQLFFLKILDLSKLQKFTEDNLNVVHMMFYVLYREENIVGEGENAGYQHFTLFPKCFQEGIKHRHCVV